MASEWFGLLYEQKVLVVVTNIFLVNSSSYAGFYCLDAYRLYTKLGLLIWRLVLFFYTRSDCKIRILLYSHCIKTYLKGILNLKIDNWDFLLDNVTHCAKL